MVYGIGIGFKFYFQRLEDQDKLGHKLYDVSFQKSFIQFKRRRLIMSFLNYRFGFVLCL
jgi:hypothetical protein